MRRLPSRALAGGRPETQRWLLGALSHLAGVDKLQHWSGRDMGPCLVLLMICSPRFPAYRGLTRATLALIVGAQCPCSHQGRTRRKLRGERSSVSCPSRDHHLGQNRGPLRSPSATESYQRTACRANAAFVTRILPDPRDVSSAGAGQSGKNCHTLLTIRPRAGTLTS